VVESYGESQRGKGLVAFCILSKSANFDETDIKASCFNVLLKRAIPDQILIIKTLPMLPNGKIDRQKLISVLPKRS
jgi:acyl-CoA synthetase (AMP-forming)/AMP-acid ligase II